MYVPVKCLEYGFKIIENTVKSFTLQQGNFGLLEIHAHFKFAEKDKMAINI